MDMSTRPMQHTPTSGPRDHRPPCRRARQPARPRAAHFAARSACAEDVDRRRDKMQGLLINLRHCSCRLICLNTRLTFAWNFGSFAAIDLHHGGAGGGQTIPKNISYSVLASGVGEAADGATAPSEINPAEGSAKSEGTSGPGPGADPPRLLVNKRELARRVLGCSLPTVNDLIDGHADFPIVTRGAPGVEWQFDAAAVTEFLAAQSRAEADQACAVEPSGAEAEGLISAGLPPRRQRAGRGGQRSSPSPRPTARLRPTAAVRGTAIEPRESTHLRHS
jgi:hypothetical protein